MISCEEKYPEILDEIDKFLLDSEIELIFTDNANMQKINKNQRNIDKTTDVLSFPYEKMSNFPIGSIVINKELAEEKANEFKHTLDDEISLLFIHGLLHILGYDHEIDNGQMREKEAFLVKKFNLPKSLIVRSQD